MSFTICGKNGGNSCGCTELDLYGDAVLSRLATPECATAAFMNTSITSIQLGMPIGYGHYSREVIVSPITHNTSITSLSLGNWDIGDECAYMISKGKSITKLNLNLNRVGPEGAKHLSCMEKLVELDLWQNHTLGCDGATHLSHSTSITNLNVSGCNISDRGTRELFSNKTLLHLDVSQWRDWPNGGTMDASTSSALSSNASLEKLAVSLCNIGNLGVNAILSNTNLIYVFAHHYGTFNQDVARINHHCGMNKVNKAVKSKAFCELAHVLFKLRRIKRAHT